MSAGAHHVPFGYSSPTRSATGSHELEDTYGAHRLRADQPWALGSSAGPASQWHTAGSVAPSSFWVEHRAAAHHTAAGESSRSSIDDVGTVHAALYGGPHFKGINLMAPSSIWAEH